jgi:hypothetical protein
MDPVSIAAVGWGISAAGWLVSPIISDLLKKSFTYLGSHSSRRLGELERKVLHLKLMLEAAEASHHRGRLEKWVKDLKSAFYDAQDILDAIEYHKLESRVLDHRTDGENPAKSTHVESAFSYFRCNTTQVRSTPLSSTCMCSLDARSSSAVLMINE